MEEEWERVSYKLQAQLYGDFLFISFLITSLHQIFHLLEKVQVLWGKPLSCILVLPGVDFFPAGLSESFVKSCRWRFFKLETVFWFPAIRKCHISCVAGRKASKRKRLKPETPPVDDLSFIIYLIWRKLLFLLNCNGTSVWKVGLGTEHQYDRHSLKGIVFYY